MNDFTGNLTIDAAKDSSQLDYAYKAKNKRDIIKNLDETVISSNINAGNNILFDAAQPINTAPTGAGNSTVGGKLTLNSANINSQTGAVALNAAQDVTIGSTAETHDHFAEHYTKTKSLLSSKSTLTIDQSHSSDAIGSSVSGETITVNAGKDIAVQGSNVVSTHATNLSAGGNVNIESVQNTDNESHFKETKQSGLMSSGGVGFTVGKSKLTTTNDSQSVTNTASTVGSVQGNTNITAGKAYTQTGSDVLAPQGDINILAQQVTIQAALNTSSNTQTSKFKQSGITLSLSSPIISAAQTLQQMASAASHTKDGRMQALAAGTAALAVSNAKDAVMASQADQYGNVATAGNTGKDDVEHVAQGNAVDAAGGINVSISLGSSNSSSSSTQTSSTAQSSHVTAGKAIHISATGQQSAAGVQDPGTANPDSGNINVIGSQIKAGNSVTLDAHNQINLIAAQNTATLNSTNKSSSGSIGIGFSLGGASNGFTINAGVSGSKGKTNGNDVSYTDSVIQAGNKAGDKVTLNSGTDTNIIGSQVIGNQVVANVGTAGKGKLNIQSLQDSSTYTDKQSNFGVSVSLCIPPFCYGASSGSVSAGKANTNSHYQSVQQQAGIFAGNGGFQVNVNGNTNLKGAVIASSDTAIRENKNSLTTQTLSSSNIENTAEYKAEAMSASVSLGTQPGMPTLNGAGLGSDSGKSNSVTTSGISGGTVNITDNNQQMALTGKDSVITVATLNRDVSINANGEAVDSHGNSTAHTIAPIFDREKVAQEIKAQVQITQAFSQQAPIALSSFAADKTKPYHDAQKIVTDAQALYANETDPDKQAQLQNTINQAYETIAETQSDYDNWKANGSYRIASNIIIAAIGGGTSGAVGAVTKESLSWAADQMRQAMIEDSMKFPGICVGTTDCISNMSGESVGVNGDGKKVAGGRIILA